MVQNLIILFIFGLFCVVNAANILFLAPCPSKSHHNWNKNIYYALAARGHNVTVFSADVDKHPTKNVHYIYADGPYEKMDSLGPEAFDFFGGDTKSTYALAEEMWEWAHMINEMFFASKGFQTLKNYPDTFKVDLIIIDYTFGGPLLGFLEKFNYPPLVGVTAFSVPPYTYDFVGGHKQQSYVPHHMVDYSPRMSLWERISNYYSYFVEDTYMKYVFYPKSDTLMRENFHSHMPSLEELKKRMSLALVNTHFSIETVEPLPPNVIPVAGLQIRDPKPLEKEIEDFINAGKRGSVLFSLGTNVKSAFLSNETKETIIRVFRDLPEYNFIWKYETTLDIPLPKNVKIQAWLSQNDILANKNVKAFISHCGLLGTQEGTWYGKPIVGIPFFADQHKNLNGILHAEAGVKIDHKHLTYEAFKGALQEVLENPKYAKNAKDRGELFRDQKTKPLDRAIFWIEWAMRHKTDYEKIELPVKNWNMLRRNGYDVLLFLLLVVLTIIYTLFGIVRCVLIKKHENILKSKKNQ